MKKHTLEKTKQKILMFQVIILKSEVFGLVHGKKHIIMYRDNITMFLSSPVQSSSSPTLNQTIIAFTK